MNSIFPKVRPFLPVLITIGLILLAGIVVVSTNKDAFSSHTSASKTATKLDADIATAEKQVASKPVTAQPYIALSELYLQKVRETSNADYYTKIDSLMKTATAVDPKNGDIPAVQASVAMGRHNFVTGKKFTTQALALNSTVPAYYGLDGDADIELGRYSDAVTAFQKMVDLRPDFASWSRIAYLRELYGDIPGAIEALNQAISAGSNYPENIAWAYVEKGKLQMRSDIDAADVSFNAALHTLPTYTQAMEGLGKDDFFRGNIDEAETHFKNAYDGLALAQYAVDLGDLYTQKGETAKAAQQYALAKAAFDLSIKGGVNTDLEESLFLADHNLDLPTAVAMATRAHEARPNEYGADYLSWALYKNNNSKEAATHTKEAFVLGEFDPLILFHQGMIAQANGDTAKAKEYYTKAYAINPNFSIQYSSILKKTLDSM